MGKKATPSSRAPSGTPYGIGFAVVNNLDGYDEISLTDEFKVMTNRYETIYKPSELGFSLARQEELYGGNTPEEASKIFNNVLENKATKAQTDCVLINASFAIQAMEPAKPIEECVAIARESLESGKEMCIRDRSVYNAAHSQNDEWNSRRRKWIK